MGFEKGRVKTGGIVKGQQQKRTADWKAISENFKDRYAERMILIMDKATDEEFAKHFKDLLEYFAPKMSRSEITQEPQKIILDLSMLTDDQLTILEDQVGS